MIDLKKTVTTALCAILKKKSPLLILIWRYQLNPISGDFYEKLPGKKGLYWFTFIYITPKQKSN